MITIYLIVFFTLPFIKVDDEPLFLFNVVQRKFIFFGQTFWPQDFFFFAIGCPLWLSGYIPLARAKSGDAEQFIGRTSQDALEEIGAFLTPC